MVRGRQIEIGRELSVGGDVILKDAEHRLWSQWLVLREGFCEGVRALFVLLWAWACDAWVAAGAGTTDRDRP